MIKRFYVNNFRCFENFELPVAGQSSALLIGKNGTGKTTVSFALEIMQKIARGTNRVRDLVGPQDFSRGRSDAPMRFEIETELDGKTYNYSIAFEYPEGFKELRVLDEELKVDGKPVYTRSLAQVHIAKTGQDGQAQFRIDWHLVALPIIQHQSDKDPLFVIRERLADMLILRPTPSLMRGDSEQETRRPNPEVVEFGAWFSGLLAYAPSAYSQIDGYLKDVMPDLTDIKNRPVGRDSRSLEVQFSRDQASLTLPFTALSDGEKCFMICAMVLAANRVHSPLVCFWDEPDNYLALDEVGHFVMALRKAFQSGGQFIATSHNPEAIRRFSDENTFVLYRNSHLEHTIIRPLSEVQVQGDLVGALIRGDLRP